VAALRANIAEDAAARQAFVEGVLALKAEGTGVMSDTLDISGPQHELSTYDLFVVWHHWAMAVFTPPEQGDRNAAHRGPVFLPWHRFMLIFLEAQLQRVLQNPDFGLPYWSWSDDGELPPDEQPNAPVWEDDCMGGDGDPAQGSVVTSGPFSASSPFQIAVTADSNGVLRTTARPLRRRFDAVLGLPPKAEAQAALADDDYDEAPWSAETVSFRNLLEGWVPSDGLPHVHNRVHVFVGGDMLLSSSPNDPVFYLNHCNVDRAWSAWLADATEPFYLPDQSAPDDLFRHRVDDPMFSIFTGDDDDRWTPRRMLDVSATYTYDDLSV
jgi:tyrosinase